LERPFIATYIEASRPMGVIYVGSTNNLYRRGREHREGLYDGFTKRHRCGMLVWYEPFEMMVSAVHRERQLKRWNRPWKMELIERRNPDWCDLYPFLVGQASDPRIKSEDDGGVEAFLARLKRGEIRE
jgi:putative endonuclease